MGTDGIEARLHRLEAEAEIRWLKAHYAQVCDDKCDASHRLGPQDEIDAMARPMVARVFAEDAVWDASLGGAARAAGDQGDLSGPAGGDGRGHAGLLGAGQWRVAS